ncbi:MAG: hypothetical protein H6707_14360 [Deltaproteobacteria bacterium]|nr:hypothetical protein [Deltaproteobacteria bacterium]
MKCIAGFRWRLIALVVLCGFPASARAKGTTWSKFKGKVVVSSQPFVDATTEQAFTKTIARAARTRTVESKDGRWNFHFIAFLKSAPGSSKLNLVWYRLGKKRPEQVDYTEFVVPPAGKTLQAQAEISAAQGFRRGDRVEVRLTRVIAGREKIYASARLALH